MLTLWLVHGSLAFSVPQDALEPALLPLDFATEGRIEDGDRIVESETLRREYAESPSGDAWQLMVQESGRYAIELRSCYFDAYLVLRDEQHNLLDEDDDGLIGTHARIVASLRAGVRYRLDACALHGGRGVYSVRWAAGEPSELAPEERRRAEREDAEHCLAAVESAQGPESPATAAALSKLGRLLENQGNYAAARPLLERSLAVREKVGPDDLDTATALNNLATFYYSQGEYELARPLLERALRIKENLLDTRDPRIAMGLGNLGSVLEELGEYGAARALHERALAIEEESYGPESLQLVPCLNTLAVFQQSQGEHDSARRLYQRALAIYQTHGVEDAETARCLNNLGALLEQEGALDEARPLHERALSIREKILGPDHPDTAISLNNLSVLLWREGAYSRALPLQERVLQIRSKALPPGHPAIATSLNNLALVRHALGDYEAARPLYERALAIRERALGPDHPGTATSLHNLALLLRAEGDLEGSRRLYERALAIREKTLGDAHPDFIVTLSELALDELDLGRLESAEQYFRRALSSAGERLDRDMLGLTEAERALSVAQLRKNLDLVLGLPERTEESAAAVLEWKSRGLRVLLAGQFLEGTALREARIIRDRLVSLRSRIADLAYSSDAATHDAHAEELAELRDRAALQELELSKAWREAGFAIESPTSDQVRKVLPLDSVLLDFLVRSVWKPAVIEDGHVVERGRWLESCMTAFVYRPDLDVPERVELGSASELDRATERYLQALTGAARDARGISAESPSHSSELAQAGSQLYERLWRPLAEHFGHPAIVLVSPDGALARLPMGALVDSEGRYLSESWRFAVLPDAGALIRSRPTATPARGMLAAGGIDYSSRKDASAQTLPLAEPRGSIVGTWSALPGTHRELDEIAGVWIGTREELEQFEGSTATKEALQRVLPGKRWIHLATHGFFEPKELPSMMEAACELVGTEDERLRLDGPEQAHPLPGLPPGLLSGLVCAGANLPPEEGRDTGLLTAAEIAFLDLSACDLAFLSACDTALGTQRGGEGMLSVQRAFHAAGARTVISSLWRVGDASTAELVKRFYVNLWTKGMTKLDALCEAQLALLNEARAAGDPSASPASWAGFVLSGDWR